MSKANTPKTSVCAHLVRLYKILLRFALGPLVSDIEERKKKLQLAAGLTRIFHGALINLSRE